MSEYNNISWQADAEDELRNLGIENGDMIYIAASFREYLDLLPRVNDLIDALVNVVGKRGTIIMPAYTRKFPMWQIYLGHDNFVFNKETTQPNTGILPSLLMRNKSALRSNHPTNSIVCIGARSREVTTVHNKLSGAYSIFTWLSKQNGKLLFLGTGDSLPALRHEIQSRVGLLEKVPYWQGVKYQDKDKISIFRRKDVGGCITETKQMIRVLRSNDLISEGNFLKMDYHSIYAPKSVKHLIDDMRKNFSNYLCNDPLCSWCRYLERKEHVSETKKIGKGKTYPSNQVLKLLFDLFHYLHIKNVPYAHRVLVILTKISIPTRKN